MITVFFSPSFDRLMRKLDPALLEAVSESVEQFKNPKQHGKLKVHTLHGRLAGLYAFSVDYRHRVVFQWLDKSKKKALLLDFGDHSVYE
jgi:mRNA-degrading endonuclease YafQ of YafQ-DinJ toxin-antitoxin module